MNHTDMDDHRNEEGHVNWASLHAAEVANGERCSRCGQSLAYFTIPGHPEECSECKVLAGSSNAETHKNRVRCPHCSNIQEAIGDDDYEFYSEGEHETYCSRCDKTFTFETHVSHSFTSPSKGNQGESET